MTYFAIIVFALADWALTLDALRMGIAREGNPLMRPVMELPAWQSFTVKIGMTSVLVLCLAIGSSHPWVRKAATITAILMGGIVLYHGVARIFVL